jgi:hypothetical protein
MPNINDAEITDIYVSQTKSAGVQDDAPNAPIGGSNSPGTEFDVTLEMVAGTALDTAQYTLTVSCADLTTTESASDLVPVFPPTAPSTVGASPWVPQGSFFEQRDGERPGRRRGRPGLPVHGLPDLRERRGGVGQAERPVRPVLIKTGLRRG